MNSTSHPLVYVDGMLLVEALRTIWSNLKVTTQANPDTEKSTVCQIVNTVLVASKIEDPFILKLIWDRPEATLLH